MRIRQSRKLSHRQNGTDYHIKTSVRVSKTFFTRLTTFEGKIRILSPQEEVGQVELIENSYGVVVVDNLSNYCEESMNMV